ncbi:PspC domain-containing protein [Fluviicola sp.]|jgi:phage shock protein PspC (stress-responsive transcriptional regulator)|uniref:PspC domain-containing protein n=1 Tax=Fluviicola sp. TaxID=1917219 RepID=UPI0028231A59|nr:PspC domain-containing protein [Fluviicola sp.]MDR0803070.1 PspC domain-containing protein [Fluviicola sp.]
MKKTLSIHLGRQLFIIEEDAYDRLQAYLKKLEASLSNESGSNEIVEDIEMRFAELVHQYLGDTRQVVTIADVEKAITSLGEPEEITEEPEQPKQQTQTNHENNGQKRMYRDVDNGVLGGLAAGIAAYLNIDPVIVRIIFIIFGFMGFGFPLYIILWIIVPGAKTPSERLQMRGKPVNIDTLKEEFEKTASRLKDDTINTVNRFKNNNEHITQQASKILRFIGKIIGVGFITGALIWLIIFTLIVSGIIDVIPMTGDQEFASLYEFLQLVSPVNKSFSLIWTGLLLVGFAGPLLSIAIGVRLLLGKVNRYFRLNFILLPAVIFVGIVLGVIGSINSARDYEVYSEVENQHLTIHASELKLEELPLMVNNRRIVSNGGIDFISVHNGQIMEHGIHIKYKESSDSLFHVSQVFSAHGIDRTAAQKRSMRIKQDLRVEGNKLLIDPYYSFPLTDGLRNQEIEIVIQVPDGKKLFINNQQVLINGKEYIGVMYANEPFEAYED